MRYSINADLAPLLLRHLALTIKDVGKKNKKAKKN